MTIIGFTGTRHDPSPIQAGVLALELARSYRPGLALAHGCCTGSDHLAHRLARRLGYVIHGFPPWLPDWRVDVECDTLAPPQSYPARDAAIVDSADRLLATPLAAEDAPESRRSGTWLTVRFARRKGIPIQIIWPDGSLTDE